MTSPHPRTADLIDQLTRDAFEAEDEGRAWEGAARRAFALHLGALERAHALEPEAACARVLDLLVKAGVRQPPPPPPSPPPPTRGRLH